MFWSACMCVGCQRRKQRDLSRGLKTELIRPDKREHLLASVRKMVLKIDALISCVEFKQSGLDERMECVSDAGGESDLIRLVSLKTRAD